MFFGHLVVMAQEKRALTHEDYDTWESTSSEKITKDGQWAGFRVNLQDGDGRLEILSLDDPKQSFTISRGTTWSFSHDDNYAFGKITVQKDTVRALKLRKTKADDMPKDSLFILDLVNGKIEKLARVKSFASPKEDGNWLAVHFEKDLKKKEGENTGGDKGKEKPKKPEGTRLYVTRLGGNERWNFDDVKSYGFSEKGNQLYYITADKDSLTKGGVYLLDLKSGQSHLVDEGKAEYLSPSFSKSGALLAYITTEDSAKAKKPYYDLYLFETSTRNNKKIVDNNTDGILTDGMIGKDGNLFFSEKEDRLYFGTAPDYKHFAYEEDTTILDEERVKLDIWGWQDDEIQPMQLKNREQEEKRSFLAAYDIKHGKVIQIGDEKFNNIRLDRNVRYNTALALDNAPYRRNFSWDIQAGRDLYSVDLKNGAKELVKENVIGNPVLSPAAKYAYWYDSQDSAWMAYDFSSKTLRNLTADINTKFYNELHDAPVSPGSYGSAGWLEDDKAFLIYDRYDLWSIDPSGKAAPVNLTQGRGRETKIKFRREKLAEEKDGIDPKSPLILNAFHEQNKKSGYYLGDISGRKDPQELIFTDNRYFSLTKAEEADRLILKRTTYQESPDIYATDLTFDRLHQLSHINAHQKDIRWGSVELVDYLANDGTPLQGLLFKPEYFDEGKKYPMMVYFYERNSDGLHNYRAPVPSASIINIPFFVSNDYVVFVPDIKYELGLPGPSAYNCVIPGVQAVVSKGFVDKDNMAIQGQSWGGYQVAYLITQTNMFKAAGAGAPVVNMTSAYGGIRWTTGMSRMFQYEQTQSRIGGTLWNKPLYYIENSPLFFMDRVKTPVLIMHNDADGAVPWYQGIEMFMALKRLNQPAWLLQYNGEDHNLRERKNRKDLSIRLSQFFDHYLKDAPAPLWMTDGIPAVEKGRTLKYELEEK